MSNALTCRSFCNRLTRCYYFNEKDNYIKYIDIFFNKLLKDFSDTNKSFIELFSDKFNSTSYSGKKFIYANDRQLYKDLCLKCAINIDSFLAKFPSKNFLDTVNYKDKLKCNVGAVMNNKNINIHFCFRPIQDMQKDLDFYLLNNYIYNMIRDFKNDCLVFNAQSNLYSLIKYEDSDYTIKRGFLKSIITSKIRKQGEHCSNCKETCKAMFINGLDRLTSIL